MSGICVDGLTNLDSLTTWFRRGTLHIIPFIYKRTRKRSPLLLRYHAFEFTSDKLTASAHLNWAYFILSLTVQIRTVFHVCVMIDFRNYFHTLSFGEMKVPSESVRHLDLLCIMWCSLNTQWSK